MTDNWIHLNTDGVVKLDAGFAAFGGVACKQEGEWIVGSIAIWDYTQFSMLNSRCSRWSNPNP